MLHCLELLEDLALTLRATPHRHGWQKAVLANLKALLSPPRTCTGMCHPHGAQRLPEEQRSLPQAQQHILGALSAACCIPEACKAITSQFRVATSKCQHLADLCCCRPLLKQTCRGPSKMQHTQHGLRSSKQKPGSTLMNAAFNSWQMSGCTVVLA